MRDDDLKIFDRITLSELEITLDLHTRELVRLDSYTAFSWSNSRHQSFTRCKRQYYLNYYGTRRVIEARQKIVSAVWWLKQVAPLRSWVGQVIHHLASIAVQACHDDQPIAQDRLVDLAIDYYRQGVMASQRGAKHEGRWRVLLEHVYPNGPHSVDRDKAEVLVIDLAHTLLESEAFEFIRAQPREFIREIDPPFQSFLLSHVPLLGDVRVFAIPDVLVYDGQQITIVDWKTGDIEHEAIRDQAGIYRLYAHQVYKVPEEAIHVQIADLNNNGESVEPPGGTPSVAEAEAFARNSIQSMINLMENIKYNTAAIRDFPMTDDWSNCRWCGFKRACWRHEDSHHA